MGPDETTRRTRPTRVDLGRLERTKFLARAGPDFDIVRHPILRYMIASCTGAVTVTYTMASPSYLIELVSSLMPDLSRMAIRFHRLGS